MRNYSKNVKDLYMPGQKSAKSQQQPNNVLSENAENDYTHA